MKVLSVDLYNIKQTGIISQNKQRRVLSAPIHDSVCFKSRNLMDLPKEEVYKMIQASLTPENFIGQGTEAEVYRIKGTDLCVKIPYEVLGVYSKCKEEDFKKLYFEKNIEPADKVNHIKINLSLGGTVMDYIPGVKPKDYINDKNKRYKLQSDISEMPIQSYKELLHQISNGIDNEMLFDCSSGNLLVDVNKNKLTAIDFLPIKENPRDIKPLSEIYSVITAYGAEQKTGKKIFENVINTGLEEFKPKQAPCMDVELFDFIDLCEKRIQDSRVENTDRLMQKITQQVNVLKKLKTTEHMNAIFSTFIEEKISEVRKLVKYIR